MNPDWSMFLTIGTPIAAVALSYGGIRALVKALQRDVTDLSEKVMSLEKEKATIGQVNALETAMGSSLKNMDLKIAMYEDSTKKHEVALATIKANQEDLQRRHNDGLGDLRNRTSTLEGRTTNIEQNAAEQRAQMNSVVQAVARVEAKQDREASSLEQIRRDLLEFVVNNRRRKSLSDDD